MSVELGMTECETDIALVLGVFNVLYFFVSALTSVARKTQLLFFSLMILLNFAAWFVIKNLTPRASLFWTTVIIVNALSTHLQWRARATWKNARKIQLAAELSKMKIAETTLQRMLEHLSFKQPKPIEQVKQHIRNPFIPEETTTATTTRRGDERYKK